MGKSGSWGASVNGGKRTDRRDAIIDAAFLCMAQHGYERTTTARICTAAGVSSGTFFHYFPTKADVLVAVLERAYNFTAEVFERIRSVAAQDASAALAQWCEHVLEEASDENLPAFVAALGAVPDHSGTTAMLRAENALVLEVLTELVAAGQAQGTIRDDLAPDRLAIWLNILAQGVLSHAVENGPKSSEALQPEMTEMTNRLLRAEARP